MTPESIQQEAQLSQRDHAMRYDSWHLVNYWTAVPKIQIQKCMQ